MILKPSLSFAGPREYRWQGLEAPAMMSKRRGAAQIITASPAGCTAAIDTKTCSFRNSLARCVQQAKHDPEAIFELRWSARIPLARPEDAGHDGQTSWYGTNRNGVAGSLSSQQSTQNPALFATRSLAVYSRSNMVLMPPSSFAGPREYRWQGLEVPVMMGKRRGTAQIAAAPPAGCAAGNRHKNQLFSQLARSLCTAGQT